MATKHLFTDSDRCRLGQLLTANNCRTGHQWRLIDNLEWQLEQSPAVASALIPEFVVTMHSRVRLCSEDTAKEMICTLAYPEEVDMVENSLSVLSLLGSRLIGCQVGDLVEWQQPRDRGPWRVAEILFQPEQAGDFTR